MAENTENNGTKKRGWIKALIITFSALLLAGLAIVGTVIGVSKYIKDRFTKKPVITSSLIASKLQDASDLTTAEMTYTGLIHYDDGGIPYLTQKKYSMIYSATIEAGIDMSEVEVDVSENKVKVTLPDVEVEEPVVDMDSIDFYDESFALFNWDDKRDGIDAVKEAKKDCKEKADVDGLKGKAYENAKSIVRKLLEELIGDRELVVE